MLDLSDLPQGGGARMDIFQARGTVAVANDWQVWTRPRNCSFIYILALGGGGGGGGGFAAASGQTGGGGSGGTGGITRAFIPGMLVPQQLYISVARGGAGGNSGAAGTAAVVTHISLFANASGSVIGNQAGIASAGQAGGTGTASAGGAAGGAGTAPGIQIASVLGPSIFVASSGVVGLSGGANAAGASGSSLGSFLGTSGSGAGQAATPAAFNGGASSLNTNAVVPFLTAPGGIGTASGAGGAGGQGAVKFPTLNDPYSMYFAGSSGGGNGTTAGGRGGDGLICVGGGGGGACNAAAGAGGVGGKGGDGLVIIWSF